MLQKLLKISKLTEEREYSKAAEIFFDLTIGKAAWPVGLGCGGGILMEDAIGLHDRFNRMEQVNDVAYVMSDEVTRKYVMGFKRLTSIAQRYWPAYDPSKATI